MYSCDLNFDSEAEISTFAGRTGVTYFWKLDTCHNPKVAIASTINTTSRPFLPGDKSHRSLPFLWTNTHTNARRITTSLSSLPLSFFGLIRIYKPCPPSPCRAMSPPSTILNEDTKTPFGPPQAAHATPPRIQITLAKN
jgi:hypothetical protein